MHEENNCFFLSSKDNLSISQMESPRCRLFLLAFFLFLLYFTLQYCIGFAIHQHESTTGVHVFAILNPLPPPSPYHPSGSSQCTSPKHPVSCIEPRLAIRFLYDIIHVSMSFSQIIPPSPSPTESKRLFYTLYVFLMCYTLGLNYQLLGCKE